MDGGGGEGFGDGVGQLPCEVGGDGGGRERGVDGGGGLGGGGRRRRHAWRSAKWGGSSGDGV